MSEPFRVVETKSTFSVQASDGTEVSHSKLMAYAIIDCKLTNAAWVAAGGPALVEMLSKHEWSGPRIRGGQAVGQPTCLECRNRKKQGHTPECAIAALLAKHAHKEPNRG